MSGSEHSVKVCPAKLQVPIPPPLRLGHCLHRLTSNPARLSTERGVKHQTTKKSLASRATLGWFVSRANRTASDAFPPVGS
jgi:hypothetical protein